MLNSSISSGVDGDLLVFLSFYTEPREAPTALKASAMSSSEVKVMWKAPGPGPGRPQGYEVIFFLNELKHTNEAQLHFIHTVENCPFHTTWPSGEKEKSPSPMSRVMNSPVAVLEDRT